MSAPRRRAVRRLLARLVAFMGGGGRAGGLRVLTYHRVNASHPRDRLSVHPAAFEAQLAEVARSGRTMVPLEEAVRALAAGEEPQALALTFDDGYEDNVSTALPILERFSSPATFFLATAYTGSGATLERYRGCCGEDGVMGWDQARALLARGHSLGGHGRTHRELARLPPDELQDEIEGCARDIEGATGRRPRLFCYPRGGESPRAREAVARAGYQAACTVRPGTNTPARDLLALRRTEVSGTDDLDDFRLKLAGGFDGWHRLVQLLGSRRLHR